jgi:hypothetical protein
MDLHDMVDCLPTPRENEHLSFFEVLTSHAFFPADE